MSMRTAGRIEIKHAVPEAVAVQALDWSRAFLEPDRGVSGRQHVTSLYLDSPELTFYRWHRQRRAHRFKLRIRGYGDRPADRVFAEVKQRCGDISQKVRVELPPGALRGFLAGDFPAWREAIPDFALDEFVARRRAYAARPTVLVSCLREALRNSGATGEVAVTVDRRIAYQATPRPDFVAKLDNWRALMLPARPGPPVAIMELKYVDAPPAWMATLLRHLAPFRAPFSKYAAAVRQHTAWGHV